MRWSETVTLEFVKVYLKHECLWNPEHPSYRMKLERDKAYELISNEFRDATLKTLSVVEVKMKIKNLRTTYVQQVHKILQKSSPDSMYEPSLIWFHHMDECLKHIITPRNAAYANLIENQETAEVDSSCQVWVDPEQVETMESSNPDPLVRQTENEYDSNNQEEDVVQVKKEKKVTHKRNRKKKFKHVEMQNYYGETETGPVGQEDEFDIYGKYIATQLRQMNLQKALRLQLQIQSLVSESRLSDISSD